MSQKQFPGSSMDIDMLAAKHVLVHAGVPVHPVGQKLLSVQFSRESGYLSGPKGLHQVATCFLQRLPRDLKYQVQGL